MSLRLSLFGLFCLLFSSLAHSAPKMFRGEKPTSQHLIIAPDKNLPRFDPSGLWLHKGAWLVVSDREAYQDLYQLEVIGKASDKNHVYQAKLFHKLNRTNRDSKDALDLEGITFCNDQFFLVDEASQGFVRLDKENRTKEFSVNIDAIHRERKFARTTGSHGAGFEGIACDAKNERLYFAQERMFRMIYEYDLKNHVVTDFFDVPAGWNSPRREGEHDMYPDYADLFFENGYLYALQRNDRLILKINASTKSLEAVLPLQFHEKEYYDTNEPYGMAESLFMTESEIFVVLDNNGMTHKKSKTPNALMLVFRRPKEF